MSKKEVILKDDIIFVNSNVESFVNYKMDEGLQFGLGFFETILIKDKIYFLNEHLERLNKSLEEFGFNRCLLYENVEEFIQSHGLKNSALKLIVTEKNVFAMIRSIPYDCHSYRQGKRVTFSRIIRSRHAKLVSYKTLNYGENILELRRVKNEGYDDCIFVNENGHITESTLANIFMIKNDKLITPPIADGLLPGVIRRKIVENFAVCEEHISIRELMSCQSAFLTNSLMGAMQISKIEDVKLSKHPLLDEVIEFLGEMIPKFE